MAIEQRHPDEIVNAVIMQLLDLEGRFEEAARRLEKQSVDPVSRADENYLRGKIKGVRLAKSYVSEEVRKWRTH